MGYGNKSISDWQQEAHEISKANGFYETPPSFTDRMVLIHSEISEAVEWFREFPENYECYYEGFDINGNTKFRIKEEQPDLKPVGIPSEMADIVIRVMDFCEYVGISLESAIRDKMEYNRKRPYRHGGKAL
jgi:NTP pyrophosphatase (non-canonical NTP hydrolase)